MKRVRFRTRLFLILFLFAVVPSVALTLVWGGSLSSILPLVSGTAAWDSAASSGQRAIAAARAHGLSAQERAVVAAHEQELASSLEQSRRLRYLVRRAVPAVSILALLGLALLTLLAWRVAGHLSRQLSRPIDELVGWTELIARSEALPENPPRRGAPEFAMLRARMRRMARSLETGRERALEAERLRAFRESARQVAHELKNPLTPIRFAVERLRREAPPALAETVDVLWAESQRLEQMARSFAQFGRLPEGPRAEVDLVELATYSARSIVAPPLTSEVKVENAVPMVNGHYDALARALSNVLLNAVDACNGSGTITVALEQTMLGDAAAVAVRVRDTGRGIAPDALSRIWEPYVTNKPGGTGLGLAIVRQTVEAHGGAVTASSEPGVGTEIAMIIPVVGVVPPVEVAR